MEKFITDISVDGTEYKLKDSTTDVLKRSGRLVIGIEGVHTRDDADVLVHDENSSYDAWMENTKLIQAALDDETYNEVVFLSGTFCITKNSENYDGLCINHVGKIVRGCGNSTVIQQNNIADTFVLNAKNVVLKDLSIATEIEYCSCVIAMNPYCRIENVTIASNAYKTAMGIHIVDDALHCIVSNCRIENLEEAIRQDAEECVIKDCRFYNNGINITSSGEEPITTIGSTTVPESKFKVLNEIGSVQTGTIVESGSSYSWQDITLKVGCGYICSCTFDGTFATWFLYVHNDYYGFSTPFTDYGGTTFLQYGGGMTGLQFINVDGGCNLIQGDPPADPKIVRIL